MLNHGVRGGLYMGNPILAGLGFSLPKRQVSNHDLVGRINTSDEFIVERTGVRTRYHVEPEQAVSALMVPAARQAIEAAGLLPEDIDLLLVNTLSPDHHDPSQACLIQPLLACGTSRCWISGHSAAGCCTACRWLAGRSSPGWHGMSWWSAARCCPSAWTVRTAAATCRSCSATVPARWWSAPARVSKTDCWTCAWAPTATTSTC